MSTTKPAKVNVNDLSTYRMVARDAPLYVIDRGTLKFWVGFGWINVRPALPADYETMPEVERGPWLPRTGA